MKEKGVSRSVPIRGIVTGYVLILFLITGVASYMGFQWLADRLSATAVSPDTANVADAIRLHLDFIKMKLVFWIAPAYAGFLLVWGILFYRSLQKRLSIAPIPASSKKESTPLASPKPSAVDREARENHDRRMFLHLLGLFQREGRLVDFFNENLDSYDDAQIGIAVRSIHESCQKVMERFVKAQPILEQEEGESISLSRGFDTNMIKLIGNVAGEPPFQGVIRHRGWKARKKDIPELSGDLDSTLIVPAEVEISGLP